MNPRLWEDFGETGVKVLIALYELNGEGDFIEVTARARIGRSSWIKLAKLFNKYNLATMSIINKNGRNVQVMRLTEKGLRIAGLLAKIEEELTN